MDPFFGGLIKTDSMERRPDTPRPDMETLAYIKMPTCCQDRPSFLEPCPRCNDSTLHTTHALKGVKTCNGCPDKVCLKCFDGARYFCALRKADPLDPPQGPLERQLALGVQSPKVEEKTENKK